MKHFLSASIVYIRKRNSDGSETSELEMYPSKKGAVAGAAAGAALGSVVPVIGTTVGAVVGGITGFVLGPK